MNNKLCLICLSMIISTLARGNTVTFAQFSETGSGGNNFAFTSSQTSASFESKDPISGALSIPVTFTLLSNPSADLPLDLAGPQAATMTFNIDTTTHVVTTGHFFEQDLSSIGSITFTRDTPDKELQQTNLLTISFNADNGGMTGIRRGQTATLTADNGQGDMVSFSSSYLLFQPNSDENLALSFTSASPCFSIAANVTPVRGGCRAVGSSTLNFLHSFTAAGTGTFASDPDPLSVFAVPEPSNWQMLLIGVFGFWYLAGKDLRVRKGRATQENRSQMVTAE